MIAIIPAKSKSNRVHNKNFRDFYQDESLVDILIQKLIKVLALEDIYLSCDEIKYKDIASKWGINFAIRDLSLIDNEVPMSHVIVNVVDSIGRKEDVLWCLVTDPLFCEYEDCIDEWKKLDKDQYDSLCVIYEEKRYILDNNHKPIGFGFGGKHIPTQNLSSTFLLNNTLFIITYSALVDHKYYIGGKPYWYTAKNFSIDIDTQEEFDIARLIYNTKRSEDE